MILFYTKCIFFYYFGISTYFRLFVYFFRLLKSVRKFNQTPYTPQTICDITKARNAIGSFSKVLLKLSENINENDVLLQRLLNNHEADKLELENLKTRQKVQVTVVHKEHKSIPSLVCNASCCSDVYKVNTKINYK